MSPQTHLQSLSWGTYKEGGRRQNRERGRGGNVTTREKRERQEERRDKTTHSTEERVAKTRKITERSDTEMDTDGGGEVGISQLQYRHKKRH